MMMSIMNEYMHKLHSLGPRLRTPLKFFINSLNFLLPELCTGPCDKYFLYMQQCDIEVNPNNSNINKNAATTGPRIFIRRLLEQACPAKPNHQYSPPSARKSRIYRYSNSGSLCCHTCLCLKWDQIISVKPNH